jgi:hypothetical protein
MAAYDQSPWVIPHESDCRFVGGEFAVLLRPVDLAGHSRCGVLRSKDAGSSRSVRDFVWLSTTSDRMVPTNQLTPFLRREPTRMTVTLTQSRDDQGEPWITTHIDHDRLPVEWLDDMRTYWEYQLSIADIFDFGVKK